MLKRRVGLMVKRGQGEHNGHLRVERHMTEVCAINILAYGSAQISGVPGNPYTYEQRLRFHHLHWPNSQFLLMPLYDIGGNQEEWMAYVLESIRQAGFPEPTDFFSGSQRDARWYTGHFGSFENEHHDGMSDVTTYSGHSFNRIHIFNRGALSASFVRDLIESRDMAYRQHMPEASWDLTERLYPPHLRVPVTMATLDRPIDTYPFGTRFNLPWESFTGYLGAGVPLYSDVLELKRDGKLRALPPENIKSYGD